MQSLVQDANDSNGFLEVRAEGSWLTLWSVVEEFSVYFFVKKTDMSPKYVIDLQKAVIHEEPTTPTYKKFCFEISFNEDGEDKVFLICAKSQRPKERWVKILLSHQKGDFISEASPKPTANAKTPVKTIESTKSMRSIRSQSVMVPTKTNMFPSRQMPPKPLSFDTKSSKEAPPTTPVKYKTMSKGSSSGALGGPVVPHLDAHTLSGLANPNKKEKKRSISKKNVKDMSGAYLESAEYQIVERWSNREAEEMAVWIDFPRLVRNIQCYDEKLSVIQVPITLQVEENNDEQDDIHIRANMREVLILFAYRLGETKELLTIEKEFLKSLSQESSVHLKNFFEKFVSPESKMMALLKAMNQSILAPVYLSLKSKFSAMDLPITDVNGSWLIECVFKNDEVVVIHSKKAKAASELPEDDFSFRWHIGIAFDKEMKGIKEVRQTISQLDTNKAMKDKTKKKLHSIKDHELFL